MLNNKRKCVIHEIRMKTYFLVNGKRPWFQYANEIFAHARPKKKVHSSILDSLKISAQIRLNFSEKFDKLSNIDLIP